jgi:hypothetical protein
VHETFLYYSITLVKKKWLLYNSCVHVVQKCKHIEWDPWSQFYHMNSTPYIYNYAHIMHNCYARITLLIKYKTNSIRQSWEKNKICKAFIFSCFDFWGAARERKDKSCCLRFVAEYNEKGGVLPSEDKPCDLSDSNLLFCIPCIFDSQYFRE